jgi:hypothetical protein
MLGELNGIRTACIANLETVGIKNFSVPDIVKLSMPACTGIPEYAAALKDLMSKDGVHFTEAGYKCLASGLSAHVNTVLKTNSASVPTFSGSGAGTRARGGKQSYYWRGFVSLLVPAGQKITGRHTCKVTAVQTSLPEDEAQVLSGLPLLWRNLRSSPMDAPRTGVIAKSSKVLGHMPYSNSHRELEKCHLSQ